MRIMSLPDQRSMVVFIANVTQMGNFSVKRQSSTVFPHKGQRKT